MNAAEIEAWTRANLRARLAYYAQPIAACLGVVTGHDGVELPCNSIGDAPDNLCPKCRKAAGNKLRVCPVCDRSHTGGSRTCGTCRQRAYRAVQKVAAKIAGPQMGHRYWLTPKGYAALAKYDQEQQP